MKKKPRRTRNHFSIGQLFIGTSDMPTVTVKAVGLRIAASGKPLGDAMRALAAANERLLARARRGELGL